MRSSETQLYILYREVKYRFRLTTVSWRSVDRLVLTHRKYIYDFDPLLWLFYIVKKRNLTSSYGHQGFRFLTHLDRVVPKWYPSLFNFSQFHEFRVKIVISSRKKAKKGICTQKKVERRQRKKNTWEKISSNKISPMTLSVWDQTKKHFMKLE